MKRRIVIFFCIALIAVVGCFALARFFSPRATVIAERMISVPHQNDAFITSALGVREQYAVGPLARVFVLPHHLVAAKEIASLITSLPNDVSHVILLSPDHFSRGKTSFTMTDAGMNGVRNDADIMSVLAAVPHMKIDDGVIQKEHGITGLVPFFAARIPVTSISPVTLRVDTPAPDLEALSRAIIDYLRTHPDTALVTSIDFSHYMPMDVADFHDFVSERLLRTLDAYGSYKAEIDSNGSLFVALKTADALGLGNVTIHAHTNSLRLANANPSQQSTSHFLVSFAPGPRTPSNVETVLVVPPQLTTVKYLFGDEHRFFRGIDHVIATNPVVVKELADIGVVVDTTPPAWTQRSLVPGQLVGLVRTTDGITQYRFPIDSLMKPALITHFDK
jgi:AmmeMemoRadiSam system protein B